jgi:hypothetical protein
MKQKYMKQVIFVMLAAILSLPTHAQIKLGFKLSPHITWASEDNKNTLSNGARINLSYGLVADYYFTENYAIATELAMTTYGVNLALPASKYTAIQSNGVNTPANGSDLTYDYRLQYFQMPLLLRMRTKEIGYLRYYGEFGLGAGWLMRSKADISGPAGVSYSNVNINEPDEVDKFDILEAKYSDDVNSLRLSMILGAGIQYNFFGNSLLFAGVRYDNGLNSFTSDSRWTTHLNFIALHAGILF